MADVITRFRIETTQFDSKLRDTAKALQGIARQAEMSGKDFNDFSQKAIESARALGTVQSGANNTKDKLRDLVGSYNDAAKAYNSLTETAKQGEFGKAMAASLQQLQQRIRETKQDLYGLGDGMKGASGGGLFGSGKLDGMLQVFGGNVMTKIAGAGLNFASELGDMVKQGIELARAGEGVRIAFERLGRGDLLDGLRQATHGTVTDLELMKAAVKFNDFKLPLDELGTMLAFAQQKAKDTGQSVDYMVDSIVTGLGRKSLMILDNLGLSAAEVKEKMAETGDMTKAVGAIIREQMDKAGDYVETAADRATKANVELENAMTRLGETFQPLSDSATSMWTDIKVGALDLLNNAVKPLIKALKEAGVLGQNARNNAGYENLGGDAKVNRMIANLGDGNGPKAYRTYKAQMAEFDRYANSLKFKIAAYGDDKSGVAQSAVAKLQTELAGVYAMRMEYERRAQELHKKATTKIVEDNNEEEQSIDSLNKKLKELQEQRKKAIASGDKKKSADLLKQINQTKNDIKGLGGGTTTTTTTHQTPQQRAQESFTKAEQNYKQALEQAAMELEAGTITRAEAKKKEMQAAEQRWKAIGDARNISDSPELKQAQDEAAAEYKRLAAEAKTATERQKALDKATRDLENANQKLATARSEMAQAKQQGDLQAYNTAKYKATAAQKEITRLEKVKVDVERGKVDLPDIPKVIEQTVNTHQGKKITDEIAKEITQTINTRLGRIVTPDILESITQTINTKIGRVVTPAIAKELTQEVNVKTGRVDLKPIPTELTQTVDVEQGRVDLPTIPDVITQTINTKIGHVVTPAIAKELTQEVNVKTGKVDLKPIPTELTQTVDVEQGRVDLPTIPDVITQTINTKVGEVLTPEVAAEVVQTINTRLGRIVTPEILESITQTINTKIGRVVTPEILESITQTINTKIGRVVTPTIAKELTQEVNVKTGRVDLKPIPTEITQKVDVEQGDLNLPAIPDLITQTINTKVGEVLTPEVAAEVVQTINTRLGRIVTPEILESITQTINTKIGRVVTPEILESITQTINTKIGRVVTPAIAKELTQEVNVKTGKVDLKPIPTELTQTVDVEQGDVNLPAIPAEVTQTVDVETGRVNLLNIPEVIEQTVNTHQGELMTADIATEITQKINTVLGNIVKPEILDEVTQTINTKVGNVITPEIAKEVTQVVNVETGTVDLEPIPTEMTTTVIFQADTRNINAAISAVKKEMDTIPVGTIKFNLDQTKLVDLTTLKKLIDEQVKNGLEIDPEVTQGLFSKIQLGVDIEDTTWQSLIDKINEKLKELDIEPISINLKTGDTAKTGKETENAWKNAASAVQSVGSALQQIEDPSAKIVGIIGQAVANIALGFAQATAKSSGGGIFAWIAAITGGLATMISTISAIHSATGYADGGIVKGNTYSGDQIPALVDGSQMVGLNAGEVVLNRSQQGVLAASLQSVGQSGEGGGGGKPYVSGEMIWLGLTNYLNRSGRGEIVTSKRR